MTGSAACGGSGSSPTIVVEFRDEFKKDNTYVRTRHNSLRCFPICSPVHKSTSFCGYPIYVSVTVDASYSSLSSSEFTLLGEIKPLLKEGRFRVGEIYDTSQFKPTSAEFGFVNYPCARPYREEQAEGGRRKLLYTFMPPNRWPCNGKTREKESYCFSASVLVKGLVVFRQDSPRFYITRERSSTTQVAEDDKEDDDGISSGTLQTSPAKTTPLKSLHLWDIDVVSQPSDLAAFASSTSIPILVNSSTSSCNTETPSVAFPNQPSSRQLNGPLPWVRVQSQSHPQCSMDVLNSSFGKGLPPNTSLMAHMTIPVMQGMILNSNVPGTRSVVMTNQFLNRPPMHAQRQWPPLSFFSSGTHRPGVAPFSHSRLPLVTLPRIPYEYQGQHEIYEFQTMPCDTMTPFGRGAAAMGVSSRYPSPLAWINPTPCPAQTFPMPTFNQQILQQHHECKTPVPGGQAVKDHYQAAPLFLRKQTPPIVVESSLSTTNRQQHALLPGPIQVQDPRFKTSRGNIPCPVCQMHFIARRSLLRHLRNVHDRQDYRKIVPSSRAGQEVDRPRNKRGRFVRPDEAFSDDSVSRGDKLDP